MAILGHIISSEGIEVDLKKMKSVKNWPRPLTPTDIQSFLGLLGIIGDLLTDSHLSLLHLLS